MFTKLKVVAISAAILVGGLTASALAKGHMGPRKAAMLAKFDANNDGQLDDAEKAKLVETRKAMRAKKKAAVLAKFDANKDGALDKTEKSLMRDQRIENRFSKLDTNKDGVVTLAEMKAAKHGKHGGKHRRGGNK